MGCASRLGVIWESATVGMESADHASPVHKRMIAIDARARAEPPERESVTVNAPLSASYPVGALGELLLAIALSSGGGSEPECLWEEEPGEYRYFCAGRDSVVVTVVAFDDCWAHAPHEEGEVVFTTRTLRLKGPRDRSRHRMPGVLDNLGEGATVKVGRASVRHRTHGDRRHKGRECVTRPLITLLPRTLPAPRSPAGPPPLVAFNDRRPGTLSAWRR